MKRLVFLLFISIVFTLNSCDSGSRRALIETEFGNITVELLDSTPLHRDNFIKLVDEGFYNNLLFHRIMNDFMIQGGDPDSKNAPQSKRLGMGNPGYTISAEIKALHYRGTLAAARKGGPANPEMESSGSQFYIVHGKQKLTVEDIKKAEDFNKLEYTQEQVNKYLEIGGYPFLDNNYTVFGKVIEGMDVLDKIANVQVAKADRPIEDVTMKIKMLN